MLEATEKHVYFGNVIGPAYIDESDWTYYSGTRLDDIRFAIGDYRAFGFTDTFNPPARIVLHFTKCYGGDVYDGYEQYNYLRDLSRQGVKIEARIEGLCASIAVLIALAADTVNMSDVAQWMVHKPTAGDSCGLNADQMREVAGQLDQVQQQLVGAYVARTGMSAQQANDLINRSSYLTADECIALGFVTGKLDQALKLPEGAEKVLNFFKPPTKIANAMALSKEEKTGLLADLKNWFKQEFGLGLKNEADPAPLTVTNTSLDVTDGDPIYFEGDTLAQGTAVYSDAEMTTAYADGDYSLADGRDMTIAGGMVESLTDAAADDSAAATNAATEALTTENAAVKAENALLKRQLTAAQNKLKKHVPGSEGNPNRPGETQVIGAKNSVKVPAARAAERGLFLAGVKIKP